MEAKKIAQFPLGLTFDDILLLPGFADFSRSDISLSTKLTSTITLSLPILSSPMDTVTESNLAIALAKLGGMGIVHRNLSVEDQAAEVKKVKEQQLLVGAAIGTSKGFEERVKALVDAEADIIVIDSAHGFSNKVIDAVKFIKAHYPKAQIMAGSIATKDGAEALIAAGADCLRVGMGPGAICTTRIVSGMGVPQVTAIMETTKASKKAGISIVADGGIKYSGDIVKALAVGASAVMMGSFFASTEEAPGKIVSLTKEQVPHRFQSILHKDIQTYQFKEYRGMGSVAAMKKGAEVKAEDEFHGKEYYKDKVLVAEGVEALVPVKGSVQKLVEQAVGGVKSGMYYVGAKRIEELWEKARPIQITQASLTESHPHSILVTNPGENYS